MVGTGREWRQSNIGAEVSDKVVCLFFELYVVTVTNFRLTSVILCNSLMTVLVVQVFVLLQLHGKM